MTLEDQQIQQGARLELLIKALNLNGKRFSEKILTSQSFISQMCSGKRPITHKVLNKITNSYANVNSHWLMTGEGAMFIGQYKDLRETTDRVVSEPGVLQMNIHSIRKRWGMSQSEFAHLFGVSRFTVGHWEAGRNMPSYEEMSHIEHLSGHSHNTLRTRELITAEIPAQPMEPAPEVVNPLEDLRARLERMQELLEKIWEKVNR